MDKSEENTRWNTLHDEKYKPWLAFLSERWNSIGSDLEDKDAKRAIIASDWKNLDNESKSKYAAKGYNPETEDFSVSDTIDYEAPSAFQPFTVFRTYYGDPNDPDSQQKSDHAWKNLFYLLHYFAEYGDHFIDSPEMAIRSYSNRTDLDAITAPEQIIQKFVIDRLDFFNMGLTVENEAQPFSCYMVLADEDVLMQGSGLLKYVLVAGDDGHEVERTACPLEYTQAWWNQISGSGSSVESCMAMFDYDPEDEEGLAQFQVDLSQDSEDVIANLLMRDILPTYSVETAREKARKAIEMIDSLYS
ncbi:hypothetical protein H072_2896 [Dactylellina haptotyla CBS 200.50]|uniref:Uncharacterized protein n=1 Tax=Dactylellina haptotyla (strain CBS 200.50) TaxID=1284197 RepID=S8AJG7_DACHA|nr:hypothetical protein H072_2896 [Dactylellina haptotyla CBS 200.50]